MPNLSKAIFNQVDHSLTLGKQQNSFASSTKINRPAFPFYTFIRIRNICVLREARWAPLLFSARSHAFFKNLRDLFYLYFIIFIYIVEIE